MAKRYMMFGMADKKIYAFYGVSRAGMPIDPKWKSATVKMPANMLHGAEYKGTVTGILGDVNKDKFHEARTFYVEIK